MKSSVVLQTLHTISSPIAEQPIVVTQTIPGDAASLAPWRLIISGMPRAGNTIMIEDIRVRKNNKEMQVPSKVYQIVD